MSKLKQRPGKTLALKTVAMKAVTAKSHARKKKPSTPQTPASPVGGQLYSVHPGVAMVQRWITEIKAKTGRSLDEWIIHIKQSGPGNQNECRQWLKDQYAIGTNTAWWLAEKAFGRPVGWADETPEGYLALAPQYVAQMYVGTKAALRPLHDEIVRLALTLGNDVRICPCKTIVPLFRRHVFAQIRPATNKRLDLGLALAEEPFTSRLRNTGGLAKKDRITHSVTIAALADIDLQVKRWLRQAYERDVA